MNRLPQHMILGACLLVGGLVSARPADDGVRLSYLLEKNAVINYDASSTLTQRFTMLDQPMQTAVTTDLELSVKVLESVLKRSTVAITYDYCRIRTRLEGMQNFPSQDTSIEMKAIKDLRLLMTISPNGVVMQSKVEAAHAESKVIMEILRSTRIFDRLFTVLPTFDISPGNKWSSMMLDTTVAPQGLGQVITEGDITMTYHGTIDTLGRTCWVITSASSGLRQYGEFARGKIQMTLDGSGSFTAKSIHDVSTGELVASHSELVTAVTMSFVGQHSTSVPVESKIVLDIHQPQSSR